MSSSQDISNEKRSATRGADCRIESENQAAHGRAHDYADQVHHHNERGEKKERGPAQKTEPEPDYDAEGMVTHN